jgi:hypothetical protein
MSAPSTLAHSRKPLSQTARYVATVSGPLKIPCCIELAQLESDKAASALFKKEKKIHRKSLRPIYKREFILLSLIFSQFIFI